MLSADGDRAGEARASADAFLAGAARESSVVVEASATASSRTSAATVKEVFERAEGRGVAGARPHAPGDDLHQDHRLACELTWNTFRDHLILEYEIPKYDGDLGAPNVFVPLDETVAEREGRVAARALRDAARQALVHATTSSAA